MLSHLQLTTLKKLSASSTLKEDAKGFQFIVLAHPVFDAAFALHGGHLVHFQAKNKPATIWTSKTAIYNNEKAIRGGVPICWPWFAAADEALGKNLPSHGFARTSNDWKIGEINESEKGVEVVLQLHSSPQTKAIWPFDFCLTLKATISNNLKLELITENTGDVAFSYRAALHSYLNISHVKNTHVSGLAPCFYNALTQQKESKNELLIVDKAIDRIYDKAPQCIKLRDTVFNHNINIENKGNDAEILWSPWIEGAKALSDMPDDGYKTMLCIESGILNKEGVTVAPKNSHILSTFFESEVL